MKKTVLITGASRGIGRAIAIACAGTDYHLVLVCKKSEDQLKEVAGICTEKGSECLTFVGDIGESQVVKNLFQLVQESYDGVDILINNAGISYVGLLTDMTDDDWNQTMKTNLSAVFYCSRAAIPHMVRRKYGKILNISSIWGNVGASCEVAYSASKAGVNGFTKALAKELAPSNIQVNALALGMIDTEMNSCYSKEELKEFIDDIPAGRIGTTEEIGNLVKGMIEGYEYMTGQIIAIDGGMI